MLTQYIEKLSKDIKSSKKLKAHSQLKSKKWTKSCYDLLSQIIANDLSSRLSKEKQIQIGVTISSKTLQKILTGAYRLSYPIDPRTLNTLNKLTFFLDADNWDDYLEKIEAKSNNSKKAADPEQQVKKAIHKAVEAVFSNYQNLPDFVEEKLSAHFLTEFSAYKKIEELIRKRQAQQTIISNNYNPSTYEILEMDIVKVEEDYAQVYTKEYWLLCWWSLTEEKYIQRFKSIDKHYYVLNKIEGVWKVKTDASTCDSVEIKSKRKKRKNKKKASAPIQTAE